MRDMDTAYKTLGQVIFESGLTEIFELTPDDLTHPQNPKLKELIGFFYQAGHEKVFHPANRKKMKLEGEKHLGRFF